MQPQKYTDMVATILLLFRRIHVLLIYYDYACPDVARPNGLLVAKSRVTVGVPSIGLQPKLLKIGRGK